MDMRSIVIPEPGVAEVRSVPMAKRRPGEALLKLLYGGVCGSDLGTYRGTNVYAAYPCTIGHEFSAQGVEAEENPYGIREGMIVTCNPYFNCGHCYSCRRGLMNCCTDNQTMEYVREGHVELDKIISRGVPMEQAKAAFEALNANSASILKSALTTGTRSGRSLTAIGMPTSALRQRISATRCSRHTPR